MRVDKNRWVLFIVLLLYYNSETVLGDCIDECTRTCCGEICRLNCDGSCRNDADCGQSENCYGLKCAVRPPRGYCQDRYDCLREEVCKSRKCISINEEYDAEREGSGDGVANPAVVIVVIVLVLGILLAIGFFMCYNYRRELKARRRRAARARRRSSQGNNVHFRRRSTAPPLDVPAVLAPPAYEDVNGDQGGLPQGPPPSYDDAVNE